MITHLYLLGDSNLVRLSKSIPFIQKFSSLKVINWAVSGCSTSQALTLLNQHLDDDDELIDCDSSAIFILLGTNDLKTGIQNKFSRFAYTKITRITRKLFKLVILGKVPPIPRHPLYSSIISEVNRWINGFHSVSNIEIVDTYSPFTSSNPVEKYQRFDYYFEQFFSHSRRVDRIHFNVNGHRVICGILRQSLSAYA